MAVDPPFPDRLEPDSIRPRPILAIAGSVLLLLAVTFGVVIWFYKAKVPPRSAIVPKEFPSPQLVQDEAEELRRVQQEQRARLEGYRWIDRDKGLIAIPIGEAMRIIAAKGTAGYAPIDTAPNGGGR